MGKIIQKLVYFFENQPLSFSGWVISFFTLLGLNLFFQYITYGFKSVSFEYFIGEVIQMYYFILYLLVVIFLYLILKVKNEERKVKSEKLKVKSQKLEVENRKWKVERGIVGSKKIEKYNRKMMRNIISFVLWGFWSIIFWPIIDKIILKDNFHLSFYIYDNVSGVIQKMFTFFGPINPVGILYGTRIETIFIILFVGVYVYNKTKSILRTFIGGVSVYVIFYISVALPSILMFLVTLLQGSNVVNITDLDIVKFFNTPLNSFGLNERGFDVVFFYKISLFYNLIFIGLLVWLQYLWNKKILKGLFKNIRLPQMFFNWGLLFGGGLIGLYYIPENFTNDFFSWIVLINLIGSILFIWMFSVIINDVEDYKIDKISNKNRLLVKGIVSKEVYLNYGYIYLFLGLLFGLTIDGRIFLLEILYILLTIIYSKYPFKLKGVPMLAGFISSLASLIIFLIGFILTTGDQATTFFPWKIIIFLGISYALILPIKDLKDINGDKKNEILTIANLLGEKFARIYFGVVVFILYNVSVVIFNDNKLFLPALFFGGVSYWIINNKNNKRNKLLYKLLLIIILYLLTIIMA